MYGTDSCDNLSFPCAIKTEPQETDIKIEESPSLYELSEASIVHDIQKISVEIVYEPADTNEFVKEEPIPYENYDFNYSESITGPSKEVKQSVIKPKLRSTSYECYLCKILLKYSKNLSRHYIETHIAQEQFECDICGKQFSRLNTLNKHKNVHCDEKVYECELCERKFVRKASLIRHNFSCRHSTAQAQNTTGDLAGNVRIGGRYELEEELPFGCIICQQKFRSSSILASHMKVHTDIKEFKCNDCSKLFTKKRNLKRHRRMHTGNGLFQCEYCRKKLTTKYALEIHQRTHTGERPFDCRFCDKKFTRKDYLNSHVRRIHSNYSSEDKR